MRLLALVLASGLVAAGADADHQRRGLAEISPEANGLDHLVVRGELDHHAPGIVTAAVIDEHGAERIPYVSIATTVNMAGGQPISLANLKALRELTSKHGIRIIHDMTRVAENAYMIKLLEPGQADRSVAEIVREICSLTDGATMSAKKDALVNIGGFLALKEGRLLATEAGRQRLDAVLGELLG